MIPALLVLIQAISSNFEPVPTPVDPGGWIRPDDYPKKASRAGVTGMVAYRLDLDAGGRVRGCSIVGSSGDGTLDATTCRLLRERARFMPARDATGHPTASSYDGKLRWALPDAATRVTFDVSPVPAISLITPARRILPFGRSVVPFRPPFGAAMVGAAAATQPPAPVHVAEGDAPPADPRVRFGQLPNGLRYRIMRNAIPAGGLSMRLRVAVGAVDEAAPEAGYAHLVEHMTFRGTANVPDGQLVHSLEQMGLALGADTTANTTPEETIFGLDFPPSRASPLVAGLFLLREVASRASFAPAALATERYVVLAEERARDGPALHADRARQAFLLDGQRLADRVPIGTVGTITNASAVALKAFYAAHYRPDRMVLVIVGDADPDEIEAGIRASFGDWTVTAPPPPVLEQGGVRPRPTGVRLFTEPGAPRRLEANWVSPYDAAPDTLARERRQMAEQLAASVLADRLIRLSQAPDAPFAAAELQRGGLFHSAEVTTLAAVAAPGRETDALAAALAEQRRLLRFGVGKPELDRAEARSRALLTQAARSSETRGTAQLANELLASATTDTVFTTPAQTAADFEEIVGTLTTADVAAAGARLFDGSGPLLFVSSDASLPSQAAIRAALVRSEALSNSPPAATAALAWPYRSFGQPGAVRERQEVRDLDLTLVRFANGTSVTIKKLPVPHDQIVVMASFGAGLAGLPAALERSYWTLTATPPLFVNGGLGRATVVDVKDHFDGKLVGLQFQALEDKFLLMGRTRPADFKDQVNLITAYLADPAFRPAAWRQAQGQIGPMLGQVDASATLTAETMRGPLLHDGDKRWSVLPTAADLAASRPEDVPELLKPSLAGPIDLVVVGDVDIDDAVEVARLTVGALPHREQRPAVRPVRFPTVAGTVPVRIPNHGRPDQGAAIAAWPVPGFYAGRADARAMQVLAGVVNSRLVDGLRGKDGLTYSPTVAADQSLIFPAYGTLFAQVEIAPDKADRFFAEAGGIMADLARAPISAEELERARAPLLDQSRAQFRLADYWAAELAYVAADPRQLDTIRSRLPELAAVRVADIQRLARTLAGTSSFRAVVNSSSAPSQTASAPFSGPK